MNPAIDFFKHAYIYSLIRSWEVCDKIKAVCCHLAFLFPSSGFVPSFSRKMLKKLLSSLEGDTYNGTTYNGTKESFKKKSDIIIILLVSFFKLIRG